MKPTITVEIVRLSSALAELHVHADFPSEPGADMQLRGRLMGPRCPGVSTIEVAYPLHALPANGDHRLRRSARAVIPDPNMFTQKCPFIYWGPVEVWDGPTMICTEPVEIGLKLADA